MLFHVKRTNETNETPQYLNSLYRPTTLGWAWHKAPEKMENISVGIPPATRIWYDTMEIEDTVQHLGNPTGRGDFKGAVPFPADDRGQGVEVSVYITVSLSCS